MMIGLFLFSMAFATTDIERFITDPNIKVTKQPDSDRRYFTVMNIQDYTTNSDNTIVESERLKTRYVLSRTIHAEALYVKKTESDKLSTTARYRIKDGKIDSITECKSKSTKKLLVFDSYEHECVYMAVEHCEQIQRSELLSLESGDRPKIDGKVVLTSIFPVGSKLKGDNRRDRYSSHSNDALNGIKDLYDGEAVNSLIAGVEPSQVTTVLGQVRRLCAQLKVDLGPQTQDYGLGGAAAQ